LATTNPLRHAARSARQDAQSGRGWYTVLARTGLVAKGISYGLVGVLAIKLALGDGGKATSREGALSSLARHGFGKVVLILLALGFAAYALWRFVQAVAETEDSSAKGEARKWGKRAGYTGRGLVYAGLTYSTVQLLAAGGRQESQDAKAHKTAATLLSWPGGKELVGLLGALVFAAGMWNAYRGITRKFEERWPGGRAAQAWAVPVGVAGHLARAVVFALIGIFLVKAAIDYKPKDAIGLDGALQKLAHASYGPLLLGITAAGLVAYGVVCLVDARLRDVSPS
jgi:hypothetical protein